MALRSLARRVLPAWPGPAPGTGIRVQPVRQRRTERVVLCAAATGELSAVARRDAARVCLLGEGPAFHHARARAAKRQGGPGKPPRLRAAGPRREAGAGALAVSCVAYALAGSVALDLTKDPLGTTPDGRAVFLSDIWPTAEEVAEAISGALSPSQFEREYGRIFDGDEHWAMLPSPTGTLYEWDPESTYVQEPPYFDGRHDGAEPLGDIVGGPGPGIAGRLDHHRPHLAGRLDQARLPRRALPGCQGRRAAGLQQLRNPPGQPSGDAAGDLRQRPAAQQPDPGDRGTVDGPPPRR